MDRLPLRVGVLVDDSKASKYVRDLLQWARLQPAVSIEHLFTHPTPRVEPRSRLRRLFSRKGRAELAFAALMRAEGAAVLGRTAHRDHFALSEVASLVKHTVRLSPQVSRGGQVLRFSDSDLQRIRDTGVDVLVRFGSGILRGDVLSVAPLGIISLHHGDNRINRGGPAGFWEVHGGWKETGFIVQRLTEELDGGDVLLRGALPTQSSFALNQAELYSRANEGLKQVLLQLTDAPEGLAAEDPSPYCSGLYRLPTVAENLVYVLRTGLRIPRWSPRGRQAIGRTTVLAVGSHWKRAAFWRSRPLAPAGALWSDPSLIETKDGLLCFAYERSNRERGYVAVANVGSPHGRTGVAIADDVREPFAFKDGDSAFLAGRVDRDVRLYRCLELPTRWQLQTTPLPGEGCSRPIVFHRGGYWWLLVNREVAGSGGAELHAFWSTDLHAGRWTPHSGNPVKVGHSGVLNAGLVTDDDSLYRAAVASGPRSVPTSIALYRLESVTRQGYEEREAETIHPQFNANVLAVTRISSAARTTVLGCLLRPGGVG